MRVSAFCTCCFRAPDDAARVALGSSLSSQLSTPIQVSSAPQTTGAPSDKPAPFEPELAPVEGAKAYPEFSIPILRRDSRQGELRQGSGAMNPREPRSRVEYTAVDELVKDVQDLRWLGQGAQGVVYEGIWQGATVAVKFSVVEDLDTSAYELLFSRLLSHPNVVQTFVAKVAVLDERTIHPPKDGNGPGAASRSCNGRAGCGPASATHPGAAAAPAVLASVAASSALYRPFDAAVKEVAAVTGATATAGTAGLGAGTAGAGAGAVAAVPALAGQASAFACCVIDTCERCSPKSQLGFQSPPAPESGLWPGKAGETATCGPNGGGGRGGGSHDLRRLGSISARMVVRANSFRSGDGFGDPFGRWGAFTDVREVLAGMGAKPGHFITQLIMEHCDHGSLHAAIQRGIFKPNSRWGPKLALRALIRTVREVAQGMLHLHSHNILHGDLKPANVLLINSRKDRRGYIAKISDFGMAQFCCRDHISDAPWGTLVYMPPERLLHGQLFPASDVYSLGVMLWEMYHGRRPYEGMHAAQIVMACSQGTTRLEWSPDACEQIVRISRSCMAPSPHDRPSFEHLMHELTHLEARVRLEDARISTSIESSTGGTSRPPSARPSTDAATLCRAATMGCMRTSTECRIAPAAAAGGGVTTVASGHLSSEATGPALPYRHHPSSHSSRFQSSILGAQASGTLVAVVSRTSTSPPRPARASILVPPPATAMTAAAAAAAAAAAGPPAPPAADWCATSRTPSRGIQLRCDGRGGGGGVGVAEEGTDGEVWAGWRSGEDGAAATIAAALAQRPAVARAVIMELIARLGEQQDQEGQEQQPQQQQQSERMQQQQQTVQDEMTQDETLGTHGRRRTLPHDQQQ